MWRRRLIVSQQQQQQSAGRTNHTLAKQRYDAFDYCVDLVRRRDRESYLCTLLLPADSRLAAFAVRAFNVELSSIRTMVSGQSTAVMRYKFWSSALEKIFNESRGTATAPAAIPEHPVAQALQAAVEEKRLSRKWLSELIDGRVDRVDDRRAFRTIKELEDFYQRIFGSVLFLTLECSGVRQVNADHAASHLGKALGLVNGLRSISADPERNLHLLPLELLVHHRVSQEDVLRLAKVKRRGRSLDGGGGGGGDRVDILKRIRDLTFDLASQAHVHLECSRKLDLASNDDSNGQQKPRGGGKSRKECNRATRLVFLPCAIVDHYLRILRKVDFELFNDKFNAPYSWLPLTLWWRSSTGTY